MELEGKKKRFLFIGLFIVPFLIAMALIFYGKSVDGLPKFYKVENTKDYFHPKLRCGKDISTSAQNCMKENTTYVITFFPQKDKDQWEKQLLFVGELADRQKGANIVSFFEPDSSGKVTWNEGNPAKFLEKYPQWKTLQIQSNEWDSLYANYKLKTKEVDSLFFPPYIIVDRDNIIRGMVTITDLKATREITARLKRLNNEYASEKKEIIRKEQ
jgi:hypothetical protein